MSKRAAPLCSRRRMGRAWGRIVARASRLNGCGTIVSPADPWWRPTHLGLVLAPPTNVVIGTIQVHPLNKPTQVDAAAIFRGFNLVPSHRLEPSNFAHRCLVER